MTLIIVLLIVGLVAAFALAAGAGSRRRVRRVIVQERPVVTERVVERPVATERVVERPVATERIVEEP